MLKAIKKLGKNLIPKRTFRFLQPYWHSLIALLANFYFGRPSEKLIVIGITGSNGKSTTVNLIAQILRQAGHKVGFISTVNFDLGNGDRLNDLKMTTIPEWLLQKWLKQMLKNGCLYAVLEMSSEGLAQNRHLGVNFDVAVFTNLTPEHLESHGGFENYKKAKAKLFSALSKHRLTPEKLAVNPNLEKTIIVNADDPHAEFYAKFFAQKHLSFGCRKADILATELVAKPAGISFKVQNVLFTLKLKGVFDIYNALGAIAVGASQGVNLQTSQKALSQIDLVPGRMEVLQSFPFTVLVDYAPEPYALAALYKTLSLWPFGKLIHVLGSTGGGRDKARRKILADMAGKTADVVIATNEDPYDDDPMEIIDGVAKGAEQEGKKENTNLFKILDRRQGIAKALSLAQPGDLVLITGKGSEQKMAVAHGKYIDWDDRTVAREELNKLNV